MARFKIFALVLCGIFPSLSAFVVTVSRSMGGCGGVLDTRSSAMTENRGCYITTPGSSSSLSAYRGNGGDDEAAVTLSPANKLRELLERGDILVMPCCYDGLTARLVEQAGFPLTFMTGFGVSAVEGFPDTQLVSYGEMLSKATTIVSALDSIPCIGDGDTGYGNHCNVKRTVKGYAQVGMAGIMIEDQVSPKRCGHTKGKAVVDRNTAITRVQAACDARDELRQQGKQDILIMARTDARIESMDEALARCKAFRDIGADIIFLEAPQSVEEMKLFCETIPDVPKLANMLEYGKTPILPPKELEAMGYSIAAYPLSLLSASIKAMQETLECLKKGQTIDHMIVDFETVKDVVGFNDYYAEDDRYTGK